MAETPPHRHAPVTGIVTARRAFLALAVGVGAALSPLGAEAKPKRRRRTYSATYKSRY